MAPERAGALALFGGVGAYFVGWTYLYTYYRALGIDVLEIQPSFQVVLVYAFPPIRYVPHSLSNPDWAVWAFAIIVVAIFGSISLRNMMRGVVLFVAAILAFAWVALFAYTTARQAGFDAAWNRWMTESSIAVLSGQLTDAPEVSLLRTYGFGLASYNEAGALRSIISTEQFHYLFTRGDCPLTASGCPGLVFKVDRNNSTYLVIEHGVEKR